ncbi:MAG: TetR/AcrR family transcriptional regulator [Nitrososphaerales archaeon]
MVECVAQYGFESTTVPMVVAAARVSSNAFYEFFTDKSDCFLAACDTVASELLSQLLKLASEPDWVRALRKGMELYLRWWQDRPAFARAYLLSIQSAGKRAFAQRAGVYGRFQTMFVELGRRARAEQPELSELAAIIPRGLVLMITEIVSEEVRAGRIERLCDLEEDLSRLAIKMLANDLTVTRVFSGVDAGDPVR